MVTVLLRTKSDLSIIPSVCSNRRAAGWAIASGENVPAESEMREQK
jgi:hypothetical protein